MDGMEEVMSLGGGNNLKVEVKMALAAICSRMNLGSSLESSTPPANARDWSHEYTVAPDPTPPNTYY